MYCILTEILERKIIYAGDTDECGWKIKIIFQQDRVWTGLFWLRIWKNGLFFWLLRWITGFRKRQ
jgi:hypothetical protein